MDTIQYKNSNNSSAGMYLHIPFCKTKCHYCDFYKTLHTEKIPLFAEALKKEIGQSKAFIQHSQIKTIYVGGGTPSYLNARVLSGIFEIIYKHYNIATDAEITIEANPDDLIPEYFDILKAETPVNRLSIGLQSFTDKHLLLMNRRHSAMQAHSVVELANNKGFNNISVDLIYGIPNMQLSEWEKHLTKVFKLPASHLSAYHLTFEPGTVFENKRRNKLIKPISEQQSVEQYTMLTEMAENHGFIQYEISNFAKDRSYSLHNTSYWQGVPYFGFGPSAHAFNGLQRRWNIADLDKYIAAIELETQHYESEVITQSTAYNEYVLTRLRTMWGVNINEMENLFGKAYVNFFLNGINNVQTGYLVNNNDAYVLTSQGLFVSDKIISDLMWVD